MLPTIITNNNRLLDHLTSVLREFNDTLMFKGPWFCGMDYLLTCSPDNANHMFNHHFSNYPKGKLFNEVFELLGDGIFNVDGDKWMDQRRMAQIHMKTSSFRSSIEECTRDKVSKVLLPLLNKMAGSGKVVDVNEVLTRFTFDTTCKLVMGVDPGCLASEFPGIPFAKAVDEIEQALVVRYIVPTFWWKLQRRFRLGREKKVAEDEEVIESFIAQCIREKRASVKDNNQQVCGDLMTPYMDHDDKFLRDTLLNFLVAGKDTIGAALVWLFWLLTNNPDVENKILEELRRGRPSSKVSDDEMIVFNSEEIEGLVICTQPCAKRLGFTLLWHSAKSKRRRMMSYRVDIKFAQDQRLSSPCIRWGEWRQYGERTAWSSSLRDGSRRRGH
ncbi:uncharacterized protein A4U43_C01F30670 [Asparagus officinalis]|uniref:noroxomaritidine synthase n=1 Tax=Asparagus officinalis TaxID=4686 RepID=A0A5P1FX33_ASPOF|nr:cytochrome P450 86B1-like [Asparagus officinalis]ONK81571.1 uncharacterized protein A4U43_C01F30670 [Asparagus officinalis]